eukprot:Nitzschia sp. Nitz4//scaffold161_size51353//24664//26892//NITZ4_006948-RA/size51353-processed-gene-0.73-mRNA-1//-1//CDS//3329537909//8280//frame0
MSPSQRTTVAQVSYPIKIGSRQYYRKDDNPVASYTASQETIQATTRIIPTCTIAIPVEDTQIPQTCKSSLASDVNQTAKLDNTQIANDDLNNEPQILKFESPRLSGPDSTWFPQDVAPYQDAMRRWDLVSQQAGAHKQCCTSITIRDHMTPNALRYGIVQQVGLRVQSIQLWFREDSLPSWLDVFSTLFPNLQHLRLFQDRFVGEEEIEVSSRMRRLYVLYRLPDLKSIDDVLVTEAERAMARPSTPNSQRVRVDPTFGSDTLASVKSHSLIDDEESVFQIEPTQSIGSHTARELGRELAHLAQNLAIVQDEDECGKKELDDSEHLAGEDIFDESLPLSGEKREDLGSSSPDSIGRETDVQNDGDDIHGLHFAHSLHSTRSAVPIGLILSNPASLNVESNLSFQHSNVKGALLDEEDDETTNVASCPKSPSSRLSTKMTPNRRKLARTGASDAVDLVSVASSHHEWTAACGVLSFRSDRACAPRLRLNFCGRGKITDGKEEENTYEISSKELLKEKFSQQTPPRTKPNRGSPATTPVRSPLADKCVSPTNDSHGNGRSANQKLPPSRSLSSPFPMQFRDRGSPLRISTVDDDLPAKQQNAAIPSSPRAKGTLLMGTITEPITLTVLSNSPTRKSTSIPETTKASNKTITKGDLPPPGPTGVPRRKVVASSLLQQPSIQQSRRARKMERRKRAFQENARSTSVFDTDLDDDDVIMEEDAEDDDSLEVVMIDSNRHAMYSSYDV